MMKNQSRNFPFSAEDNATQIDGIDKNIPLVDKVRQMVETFYTGFFGLLALMENNR